MSKIIRADVRERLKLLRKAVELLEGEKNATQEAMGAHVGVSKTAWQNWEKRQVSLIGPEEASRLVDRFGVTLDWIYRGEAYGLKPGIRQALDKALASGGDDDRPTPRRVRHRATA